MVATSIVNSIKMKPDEKGVSTGSILAFQPLFITYAICYLFMQVVPKCHSVVQSLDETSQKRWWAMSWIYYWVIYVIYTV